MSHPGRHQDWSQDQKSASLKESLLPGGSHRQIWALWNGNIKHLMGGAKRNFEVITVYHFEKSLRKIHLESIRSWYTKKSFRKIHLESKRSVVPAENLPEQRNNWKGSLVFPDGNSCSISSEPWSLTPVSGHRGRFSVNGTDLCKLQTRLGDEIYHSSSFILCRC